MTSMWPFESPSTMNQSTMKQKICGFLVGVPWAWGFLYCIIQINLQLPFLGPNASDCYMYDYIYPHSPLRKCGYICCCPEIILQSYGPPLQE
ncbi:hypothetical protein A6R68_00311 [Neotoma lepida]|uniref:Uncharacterized protein n=1 Tax=Neotoma lepida TaxID=56216 RepID=A0A1A6GXT7_NEOLE|nr:hypothetical protein A6R68_00311 [Neotoma lepida]